MKVQAACRLVQYEAMLSVVATPLKSRPTIPFPRSLIGWPLPVKISTFHISFYRNIVVEMFLPYIFVATGIFLNILHHKGTEIKQVISVAQVLCLHKIVVFSPSLLADHLNMHHVYPARVQASSGYLIYYLKSISCRFFRTVYTLLQLQNHICCGQIPNGVDNSSFMCASWETSTSHTAITSILGVFFPYLLLYASYMDHMRDSITWEYDNVLPSPRSRVHF